ncbi:MAG: UrcA family protein [Sphingomicrobium sp.]
MRIMLSCIALAALAVASPAAAQAGEETYSVAIAYGDLNVGSDLGLSAFLGRVKANADRFCVGVGDSPLQQLLQAQQCRAKFVNSAERELGLADAPAGGTRIAAR